MEDFEERATRNYLRMASRSLKGAGSRGAIQTGDLLFVTSQATMYLDMAAGVFGNIRNHKRRLKDFVA